MESADALLSPLGGSPSLTAGGPARLRDFQILRLIGRALEATNQFSEVRYKLPEEDAAGAGVLRMACLQLAAGSKKSLWDDGASTPLDGIEREAAFVLTIISRFPPRPLPRPELNDDPEGPACPP